MATTTESTTESIVCPPWCVEHMPYGACDYHECRWTEHESEEFRFSDINGRELVDGMTVVTQALRWP